MKNHGKFDGDPYKSTFKRVTILKNGISWTGYSKAKDVRYYDGESNEWKTTEKNEKLDKIGLICNWILREYKNGYLQMNHPHKTELDRMEFSFHSPMGSLQYLPIVTLYYTFPDWDNSIWFGTGQYAEFEQWISRFYQLVKLNSTYEEMHRVLFFAREAKQDNKPARDPFNMKNKRFSTMNDLNLYCTSLKLHYPIGEIMHFYNQYKAKYFNQ